MVASPTNLAGTLGTVLPVLCPSLPDYPPERIPQGQVQNAVLDSRTGFGFLEQSRGTSTQGSIDTMKDASNRAFAVEIGVHPERTASTKLGG
jgi:hypothetical protein